MKKLIILYLLIFFISSCSSTAKIGKNASMDRPFLDEYKTFYLTYGIGNSVFDVSMDGKGRFAYISKEESGSVDIFAIDTYTLKQYRMTKNPAIDSSPSINRNNKHLVFSSTRDDAYGDLYLFKFPTFYSVNDLGSIDIDNLSFRLTDYKGLDSEPEIAREKNIVVFVSDRWNATPTIHLISLDRKEEQRLTDIPSKMPTFSFDDKQIAFISMDKETDIISQLAIVDIETKNTQILTDTSTFKFNPSFYNDDIVLYFEVYTDTDNDKTITYADTKNLMAYSISQNKSYVIEEQTELTSFFLPYASSTLGAFVDFKNGTGNVSIGNTKTFFIKDNIATNMYNTFLKIPYEYKKKYIDKFDEYFTNDTDKNIIAQANFNYMITSYIYNEYEEYLYIKHKILRNYSNTTVYDITLALEKLTAYGILENISNISLENRYYVYNLDAKDYTNINSMSNVLGFLNNNQTYNSIWARYIAASELSKYNASLIEPHSIMEQSINLPIDTRTYINMVKLYCRLLLDDDIALTDIRYSDVYRKADLSFSQMLDIAKATIDYGIEKNKLNLDFVIENLGYKNPLAIQARFAYIDSLIITGNVEYAKSLFTSYESGGNDLKAIMNYGLGRIERARNNTDMYSYFERSITLNSDFNNSIDGKWVKDILASYYLALANEFYGNGEYIKAYNNYVAVLKYNPDDSTASQRRMETSLHISTSEDGNSLNSISSVEKMVFDRERFLLENRYSDANAHLEIATTYYYLANKYYSYAIQNAHGKNRYLLQNKRRQDGFNLYLLKAFNTIINEAISAIDVAIFLDSEETDYYIFKAQMLATAMTMRIEIKVDDKKQQSLLDLVSLYGDDNNITPDIESFSRYQMSSDTLEYDILASLIEAKRQVNEDEVDSSQLSLMLANAYLINGLYIEASREYEEARSYVDKSSNKKEKAWYNFFYGYSLWINGYIEESIESYEIAYQYFKSINDTVAKFRVLGYLAIANIDEHKYFDAIKYLKERDILLTKNNVDTSLNDLLLSTCYLKNGDYSQALAYCDKVKPYIDALDPLLYDNYYITISVFGSVVPIVNMGLAAFGGYIPDEPLNIDKKEMLYSLYQEIYEEIGNYPSARHSLNEYRKATENDEVKKNLRPLFLSMYKNNEGALYYLEGDNENAISSFDASIKEYQKSLGTSDDPQNNAENDAINYINLTYIYLNTIADTRNGVDVVNKALEGINIILPNIEALSENSSVDKKNRFLLHSNIAAINYVFAQYSANMFKDDSAVDRHDNNMRRIIRIKEAIDRYKYVLSSDFEIDTRTEVVLRYNLGLCFDFAQSINEATREYTAAYSIANRNNYLIEEIGILSTMLEFSKKYHRFNKEIISSPDVYAKRILDIAKNDVFSLSFYPQSRLIILIAKNNLINYYGVNNIAKVIEVATLFDAITARIDILKDQKLTFNDANMDKYLKEYYIFYNRALSSHNKYIEDMAIKYDRKLEIEYIDEIRNIENEARKKLKNSPIKEFALGTVDSKTIQKKLLKDETLIWDVNSNIRLLMNRNKVDVIGKNEIPINFTKNVTHIGFMQIRNIDYKKDTFYRWLLFSSSYIIPNTTTLFDVNKYSVFVDNKSTLKLFTYSAISNTNKMLNISSIYGTNSVDIINNIINATNDSFNTNEHADYINKAIYSNYMNYEEISKYSNEFSQLMNSNDVKFMEAVYSGDLITIERELVRKRQISFRPKNSQFTSLTNAMNLAFVPFILDLSAASNTLINRYIGKSPYIIYSDKKTFSNYSRNMLALDPYVIIVGHGKEERANFYTNYISRLMTNSVENVMRGVDPNKYRVYGIATLNAASSTNTINNYQNYLFGVYMSEKPGRDRYIAATNLINFLDTTNKKIHYYTIISEKMLEESNTNASKAMLDLAYRLFVKSSSSSIGSTNARNFMLKAIPLYRSFNTNEIYTNAYRMMHYISNYGDNRNDVKNVTDKYLEKPVDIFRYVSRENDSSRVSMYLDLITPYIGENYKYRDVIYEYAIVYKTLYANEDLSNSSYLLDRFSDSENLIKVLNTLRQPIDSLIDEDVFYTMNYLYAKPMVFNQATVNQFANKYYSLYKTNASYIFGLLEKRRYATLEFSSYIDDAKRVFDNEKEKSLFCFYTIENGVFIAYVYSSGYDIDVKKYSLGKLSTVKGLLGKYKSFTSGSDRESIIIDIQNQMMNKEMVNTFDRVENVYITGALYTYNIPFMFFKFSDGRYFGEKNIVKVRRIKYASNNDFMNIEPTVKFIENKNLEDNFYLSLEKASVLDSFSMNSENNRFGIDYYMGYTNRITNYIDNSFLSPSTTVNINNYLRNKNNGSLLFTHVDEQRGDYYTTLKKLYINLKTNNIIKSYQNALFHDKDKGIKSILEEDDNIRYGSDKIFDYILPYVPRYENNKKYETNDIKQ